MRSAGVEENWNRYLALFDEQYRDIYFTEEYVKLHESKDDSAECFVCRENEKLFLFPFLKRRVAITDDDWYDIETPYGYGGPICNSPDPDFAQRALLDFQRYALDNRIVAGFIRFHPLLKNHRIMKGACRVDYDRNTVYMDLTKTGQQIWENEIHGKHRNVIRKAMQHGLEYMVDLDFKHLHDFIEIYAQTMKRLGSSEFYFFDDRYFSRLRESLSENAFLGIALRGKTLVSGAVFFKYGPYGHYHLSGSREDSLDVYPNNFLLYQTALYLKEKQVSTFHLGGGTDGRPGNSLYRFKKRFSRTESAFYTGRLIFNEGIYNRLCRLWEDRYPKKKDDFGTMHLKYRY